MNLCIARSTYLCWASGIWVIENWPGGKGARDNYRVGQMPLFTVTTSMRDNTKRRNYSATAERFRREQAGRRKWGLAQRHARKMRSLHGSVAAAWTSYRDAADGLVSAVSAAPAREAETTKPATLSQIQPEQNNLQPAGSVLIAYEPIQREPIQTEPTQTESDLVLAEPDLGVAEPDLGLAEPDPAQGDSTELTHPGAVSPGPFRPRRPRQLSGLRGLGRAGRDRRAPGRWSTGPAPCRADPSGSAASCRPIVTGSSSGDSSGSGGGSGSGIRFHIWSPGAGR
jgi:hypothetical protein